MPPSDQHDVSLSEALGRAAALLASARSVWLGTHIDPDGDAIGSVLGLAHLLRRDGRRVTVACRDPAPHEVDFLPGARELAAVGPADHDVAVALDAADEGRLDPLLDDGAWSSMATIVLDHHQSNSGFGQVDVVDARSASTAEIVLALADKMGIEPNAIEATCLLTGIVTDTLGFRTSNTRPETLQRACRLMECGASLSEITQAVFYRRRLATLRATALAITRLQVIGRFGVAAISAEDMGELGLVSEDVSGLSSFLISAEELEGVAVLRERDDGSIDVSMRSKPSIDLVPAARALGGGGHPQAAGASLSPPLDAAVDRVMGELLEKVAAETETVDS